ncbi:hypothetical protein D3C78_1844520 [compost metagenome]
MAAGGGNDAGIAQETHGATNDHRIGAHAHGKLVRGQGLAALGHVQERVQDGGKAAVFFHVTSIITNRSVMQGGCDGQRA